MLHRNLDRRTSLFTAIVSWRAIILQVRIMKITTREFQEQCRSKTNRSFLNLESSFLKRKSLLQFLKMLKPPTKLGNSLLFEQCILYLTSRISGIIIFNLTLQKHLNFIEQTMLKPLTSQSHKSDVCSPQFCRTRMPAIASVSLPYAKRKPHHPKSSTYTGKRSQATSERQDS